ncbi:hypothetical protein PG999_009556 [Apiospora kogelbergensis]|uniref:Uncharacterized protein n=1 Tax=Apiospora kogelbergensis TaxID=1337665 RepID=A0AAW0QJI5_9PEZI
MAAACRIEKPVFGVIHKSPAKRAEACADNRGAEAGGDDYKLIARRKGKDVFAGCTLPQELPRGAVVESAL